MANNIFTGYNVARGKQTISFVDAGININNTFSIIRIRPKELVGFDPSRTINGINGFEINESYYIMAKADMDLSSIVSTTFSEGSSGAGALLLEDGRPFLTQ